MSHDTLDAVCREQLDEADAVLMLQRHRRALVLLTARNGEIILVSIGCGGMQGDGQMPDQFGQKYTELLDGGSKRHHQKQHLHTLQEELHYQAVWVHQSMLELEAVPMTLQGPASSPTP